MRPGGAGRDGEDRDHQGLGQCPGSVYLRVQLRPGDGLPEPGQHLPGASGVGVVGLL